MASRIRTSARLLLLGGALVLAACDASRPVAPAPISVPTGPNRDDDVGDGSSDCPPGVPASDCVPLSQAERQVIWW
jgi:hypothetical protein